MYHAVYVSYATRPLNQADLLELLQHSRKNNKDSGITGMLLYLQDKFIQALEGDAKSVKSLLAKIETDPRHKRMSILLEGNTPQRLFTNWSMGFKSLDFDQYTDLSGYSDLASFFGAKPANDEMHPVLIFLHLFYKKNFVDFPEVVST